MTSTFIVFPLLMMCGSTGRDGMGEPYLQRLPPRWSKPVISALGSCGAQVGIRLWATTGRRVALDARASGGAGRACQPLPRQHPTEHEQHAERLGPAEGLTRDGDAEEGSH